MTPVSLAVNNETIKVNNRPRVGVRHGTSDEVIALRLARSTARAIRLQIMRLRSGAQARVEANRFASMVIDCASELDEASLVILEHVLRALWVSSNPRKRST